MTKGEKLHDIVTSCEACFSRGAAAGWKHSDFIDLSRAILRDTGVNISPSTLKRIFGKISVDDDYIPQQATLDALKKYGRYAEPENPAPTAQPNPLPKKRNFSYLKIVLPVLTVSAVIAGLIIWQPWKQKNISGNIKMLRTEGQLPATVVFELQLPETEDSLFVNFGDKSPVIYLKPGEKTAAHIYYIPGVFTASLQTRRQAAVTTVDTAIAYISSNEWITFACHRQDDIPVHFFAFPAVKTGSDSLLEVTNNQLSKMGLDTTGPVLTRLSNYSPFAHTADDFIFETTFKNALPEKGVYCRSTQFQVSGSNSMIRFRLVNAGCSQRILNVLSEQTFKGATTDLSQFVVNLNQWNTVKLVNHNRQVILYVNGKQIFTGKYQLSLGDIRGLFLEFEGTGTVKNCDLTTYEGKLLYHF